MLFSRQSIFLLLPMALVAQESIAVLNLEGTGISASEAIGLTDRFRTDLVRTNKVTVVERSQMETILKEQDFQLAGCTSAECAVEVGQLLGVTSMVAGTIGKLGSTYIVDIRMIDVQSGKITLSLKRDYRGEIDGLLAIIAELADELVSSGNRVTSPPTPAGEFATITLSSEPSGALVTVDGAAIGVTPISDFEVVANRQNVFSLSKPGYAILDTSVSAASGQNVQLITSLIPVTSWLSIDVTPPDAIVTMGGQAVPVLPLQDEMIGADTAFAISFAKDGYQPFDTLLYTIRGVHHDLHPRLAENPILAVEPEASPATKSTVAGESSKTAQPTVTPGDKGIGGMGWLAILGMAGAGGYYGYTQGWFGALPGGGNGDTYSVDNPPIPPVP